MNETKEISIIGGMTVNIEGRSYGPLMKGERNTGRVFINQGGVGRNIAENLGRMGQRVRFLSVAGKDTYGVEGRRLLQEAGVNVSDVRLLDEETTAMFMYMLDDQSNMDMILCDLEILDRITPKSIDAALEDLLQSPIVGMDTNLPEETLWYATEKLAGVPMFLDPVSVPKSLRARNIMGRFHTVKPNKSEAEILSGRSIDTMDDLPRAGSWFLDQGVKRVFISMGGGGVFYMEDQGGREDYGVIVPQEIRIISTSGTGDAFSAALLRGFVLGQDARTAAEYGMAAAAISMGGKGLVNSAMSDQLLREKHDRMYGSGALKNLGMDFDAPMSVK